MRKIYPSLFNKFAVFILYGLLSVAVITLAQSDQIPTSNPCTFYDIASEKKINIIGYVQLETDNITEPSSIQWSYYDYINIIAYPKVAAPEPWIDIHPNKNNGKINDLINSLKGFVDAGKATGTQVLLSIRNFDPSKFPGVSGYDGVATDAISVVTQSGLAGVDIEYPGMRGHYCSKGPNNLWDDDEGFRNFMLKLHNELGGKILMLTAGKDVITGMDGIINYLNIETFHDSFYENFKNPDPNPNKVMSNPNAPLTLYQSVHDNWVTNGGITKENIIMGIDLGNTLQVVNNNSITYSQTVETDKRFDSTPGLVQINFCPGQEDVVTLYQFQWNQLLKERPKTNTLCYEFDGWTRKFDPDTSTSWLYRIILGTALPPPTTNPGTPQAEAPIADYEYVSYEDFVSINRKLSYAVNNSIWGISIFDITYDSIGENSLVNYMQSVRMPGAGGTGGAAGNPGGPGGPDNRGKIVGGVIGGIVGVAFIAGAGFLWYRNKQKQQNLYDNKNFNYPHITDQGNPGMVPEGSPRVVPPTTVIPIASGYVTAMFDFEGKEENDLSFKKGDKIEVLERGDGPNDWWVGKVNGTVGEFPGNYVRE